MPHEKTNHLPPIKFYKQFEEISKIIFPTHTNINIPWSLDLVDTLGHSLQVFRFWLLFHRSSPLRIESAIRGFGSMLQALGLLSLLFAIWFSSFSCLLCPIIFLAPSRLAFIVLPLPNVQGSQFSVCIYWLVIAGS